MHKSSRKSSGKATNDTIRIYHIYIIVYIPPDNRTDCSNRDMMTTAKHNRRIKLLGDNKPRANIRVNGEWQYRSEGLSCQSEVIGLLIVLQNKRRLLYNSNRPAGCNTLGLCLSPLARSWHSQCNATNARRWCDNLDNDQLMKYQRFTVYSADIISLVFDFRKKPCCHIVYFYIYPGRKKSEKNFWSKMSR